MKGKSNNIALSLVLIFLLSFISVDSFYSYMWLKNNEINRDGITLFDYMGAKSLISILIALLLSSAIYYFYFSRNSSIGKEQNREAYESYSDLIKHTEHIFASLLKSFPCNVIVLDKEGKILYSNQSSIFEHSYDKGMCYTDLAKKLGLEPEDSVIWKSYLTKKPIYESSQVYSNIWEEDTRTLYVMTEPVYDEKGELDALVAVLLDITEQTPLAERLKALNHPDFIANVAATIGHEVGNPLTTVRGYAQLLERDQNFTNEQKVALKWIMKESDRAISVVEDLVQVARCNRLITWQPLSIRGLLHSIAILLEAQVEKCNGKINLDLQCHANIYGDPKRLRQVILNIVLNSIEALPEKDGQVWIKAREDKGIVHIEIEDNGRGMSAQDLEKLKRPFFTTKSKATGLGITMAFQIIEEHQGCLEVFSNEGVGTMVRISLPIVECDASVSTSA
ncbi:two-component system sensor histidine kinase NtrB [Heliorestis acidaminivorans]|nr:ATP-binding protein [Heliorestis acidaminivorans]